MGSKQAIVPAIHRVLAGLEFETALDAFSGSGAVAYLLKAMGKTVICNDLLAIAYHTAAACVVNEELSLSAADVTRLLEPHPAAGRLIQETFQGLYFSDEENRLLDSALARLAELDEPARRSMAIAALTRACLRRQPRGIFTFTGRRYDDGRRDLRLSLAELIQEAADRLNQAVFVSGRPHRAYQGDVFALPDDLRPDLVYIDPPYVSPHSDNDYSRRYHFVEGLARGWQGLTIQTETRTRKFRRLVSRFDRSSTIYAAFADLFARFADSIIVVSYSSNSIPTRDEMVELLRRVKPQVTVHSQTHHYSFGTHGHRVGDNRNRVEEFLFVGQ